MKIKINVKEEHIINGECSDVNKCAIALAVRDIIPEVEVYSCSIDYNNKPGEMASLPDVVVEKIELFDDFEGNGIIGKARLEHLQPFSFVVDVDESKLFPDKFREEIEQIIEGSNNVELVAV